MTTKGHKDNDGDEVGQSPHRAELFFKGKKLGEVLLIGTFETPRADLTTFKAMWEDSPPMRNFIPLDKRFD